MIFFLAFCVALGVMVLVHLLAIRRMEQKVIEHQEKFEALQRTLNKQSKESVRNLERTRRSTERLADRCRHLLDESELAQQRTNELMGNKQIRRIIDHGR